MIRWEWLCLYYFFLPLLTLRNYVILTVFLHRNRQLSCRFYSFEKHTQFWYTDICNFHDDFIVLNGWRNFFIEIGKFPDDFMSWTKYAILSGGYFGLPEICWRGWVRVDIPVGLQLLFGTSLLCWCWRPQICIPNPVEDLLKVYEDMVEVLLVLEIFLT